MLPPKLASYQRTLQDTPRCRPPLFVVPPQPVRDADAPGWVDRGSVVVAVIAGVYVAGMIAIWIWGT